MTSRKSSGSIRAESAVEPTRPQNITVTWRRSARSFGNGALLAARVATQSSDGIQELHTVTKRGDTKLLQVLVRQAWENRLVYVILAEGRLVFPETQAPQPDHYVHDGCPSIM